MLQDQLSYSRFHSVDNKRGSKSVIVNGKEYRTTTAAANAIGISQSSLSGHLRKLEKSNRSELEFEMMVKTKVVLSKLKPEDNQES